MVEFVPVVAIIATMTMVVLVVFFVTRARQRRVEAQVEMQARLIDRFGSAPELVTFLQSPAGRHFVAGVQSAPGALARDRIMTGFSRAIVLTMLGVAFLFLTYFEDRDFAVPAALLFFLGVGYLIATLVSWKMAGKIRVAEAEPQSLNTDLSR